MKLSKLLLRWYKSFHYNFRLPLDKGETNGYRPWNKLSPSYTGGAIFPFIEIPIDRDITTVVGANESGKSHLLNAISKVVRGVGVERGDDFRQTDLCHYASVRTRNVDAWPNIGLEFKAEGDSELQSLVSLLGIKPLKDDQVASGLFAVILAQADDERHVAQLFIHPSEVPIPLESKQLENLRTALPRVQFIDSQALLPSELPLASLIAGYGEKGVEGVGLPDRRTVEKALQAMRSFSFPALQQQVSQDQIQAFESRSAGFGGNGVVDSTMRLFQEIKPESEGLYDKMGVLQEVLEVVRSRMSSNVEDKDLKELKANVISICDFIREGLESARSLVAKTSTVQAVKRIINQFQLVSKGNVSVTTLQSLFVRIRREAAAIGGDGEALTNVTTSYLAELEKLRSAGQERITGDSWDHWSFRIDTMKKDPLSATLHMKVEVVADIPSDLTQGPVEVDEAVKTDVSAE